MARPITDLERTALEWVRDRKPDDGRRRLLAANREVLGAAVLRRWIATDGRLSRAGQDALTTGTVAHDPLLDG